jgi:hypothetical protein
MLCNKLGLGLWMPLAEGSVLWLLVQCLLLCNIILSWLYHLTGWQVLEGFQFLMPSIVPGNTTSR